MKRGWTRAALIAAVFAACFMTPLAAQASVAAPSAQRVVLVLAPYLTWGDVSATSTPNIWRLAEKGALGNVNARSRAPEWGEPASPAESALAISAGNWAQPDYGAAAAYNATETYVSGTMAATVYQRLYGAGMGESHVGYLGLAQTRRANTAGDNPVILGTLGQAIEDAGGLIGAIGNSDATGTPAEAKLERPAALAAMDASGLVRFGDVSADLTRAETDAPYGIATDREAFARELSTVYGFALGHRGPSLIVLDPGDLYRARRFAPQATPAVAARQHAQAIATLDSVVGMAAQTMGSDGVVMVVSQAQSSDVSGLTGMGPIVVAGPGWSGYLTSASTHRTGLVTNLDVTATILDVLGVVQPVQVVGDPMRSVSAPASAENRAARLAAANAVAVSVDGPKASVLDFFVNGYVIVLLLVAGALALRHSWPARLARAAHAVLGTLVLALLAVPVSAWLMFVFVPSPASGAEATRALVASAALLLGLALLTWWKLGFRAPAMLLTGTTALVLLIDQWLGAPLSFSNFLGYSPLMAARFYGMGNEAAGLLVGASLVCWGLVLDRWRHAPWADVACRYGTPVLGAVVVVTAAAPFAGANVGVAIWGLVGYVVMWALANGYRITWKTALVAVVLVVVMVFAFAAIDLASRQPTHLARSLTSAEQGGMGQLVAIVARKAATNARVLSSTTWSTVLLAGLAFLGFGRFVRRDEYLKAIAESPAFGSAMIAVLAAGLVALFSEDSGIVIPALALIYPALTLAWLLLLDRPAAEEVS